MRKSLKEYEVEGDTTTVRGGIIEDKDGVYWWQH